MSADHDRSSGPPAVSSESLPPASAPDPLSDVLQTIRLTGAIFFLVDAACPWAAEAPDSVTLAPVILPKTQHVVSYHIVTEGQCWCRMNGAARPFHPAQTARRP